MTSDHPSSSNADDGEQAEQELFQALDGHMELLRRGGHVSSTLDLGQLPQPTQKGFRNLLECLYALDRLAPPPPPDVQKSLTESSAVRRRQIGPYELLGEIGRGGMGIVYRARHSGLNADVALKVIRSSDLASAEEIRRFQQEARAAAGLSHPGIIRVRDVGECEGLHYLTMDLVEGPSLATRLRNGPLDVEEAALLMASVARAVHHLHTRGVVHRDLKPSNVLFDETGQARISDFGLAKVVTPDAERTLSGTIIGTPDYMSPEQASGHSSETSPRSDIFSLGAILYETLTGQTPFRGDNPLDTLLLVLEAEPTLPRKLVRSIPSDLEQICLRCLEKNPARRYASAAELADDLQRFADGDPLLLPSVSWIHRFRRTIRREPALVSHWLALGLAATIVQVRAFFVPVDRQSHLLVMGILALWAFAAWVFQRWMRRERYAELARYVWSAADALLYTTLLHLSESWNWPTDMLIVGYPVMMTGAALWFRIRLVWFMTLVCVMSYAALWIFHPAMHRTVPAHYPLIVAAMLVVIGANVSYQVYRFKLLDRVYHRRSEGKLVQEFARGAGRDRP